ncbi:MAG: ATP-dependent nuclease, partial [Acidimicrobiales bacterium]
MRAHLVLDQSEERELLLALFKAAIFGSFVGNNYGPDWSRIEAWTQSQVTEQSIAELFEVDVVVMHDGTAAGLWECRLEFKAERDDGTTDTFSVPLLGRGLRNNILSGVSPLDHVSSPSFKDRLVGSGSSDNTAPPVGPFTLGRVLPVAGEGTTVTVALGSRNPPPLLYEDLAQRLGISPTANSGRDAGFHSVLRHIVSGGLLMETDARLTTAIANSEETGTKLLRMKNGGSKENLRFRAIVSRFEAFTQGRDVDVILAPDGEAHSIWVSTRRDPDRTAAFDQIPIGFAGSGAWEALILAERMSAPSGSLVAFDEPGVTWHPNLQRQFLNYLREMEAQVILITHSPYLIPIDAKVPEYRLARMTLEDGLTRAHVAEPATVGAIVPKLRQTGNERVVFASAAILCEGKIDQAAVRVIAEHEDLDLDALNVTVVDCAGRENMPDY